MLRNTQSYRQTELPLFQQTRFSQHNLDFEGDMAQVVEGHFVPQESKRVYEEWKVANPDLVREHGGRYALVTKDGITRSMTKEELFCSSIPISPDTWLDYIAPDFGSTDTYDEAESARWNSSDFHDVDELKPWLNLTDRRSHFNATNATPVSRKIKRGVDTTLAPALERKKMEKFLTYNSFYSYGTEQFAPMFSNNYQTSGMVDKGSWYQPNSRYMGMYGMVREFIPGAPYMLSSTKRRGIMFEALRGIDQTRFQVVKTHPTLKEIHITEGENDLLHSSSLSKVRYTTNGKRLLTIGTTKAKSAGKSYHPDHKSFQRLQLKGQRMHHCRKARLVRPKITKRIKKDD